MSVTQCGSGVPPHSLPPDAKSREGSAKYPPINYFDPEASIAFLSGDLPHWRQQGVTYFVTFRLNDSLPREKLDLWREERTQWMHQHPEPHDEATRREYYDLFPYRLQQWLDAGAGSCILALPDIRQLVENALAHFNAQRYRLHDFVVAPNPVHALVVPEGEHTLSEILHSWKSFTAHEIIKNDAARHRLQQFQPSTGRESESESGSGVPQLSSSPVSPQASHIPYRSERRGQRHPGFATFVAGLRVWQKESFDHIVRSPASMEKFRAYIRNHGLAQAEGASFLS